MWQPNSEKWLSWQGIPTKKGNLSLTSIVMLNVKDSVSSHRVRERDD